MRNRFREPSETVIEADIAAIDAGEGRTAFCQFRGLYGRYPRRFRSYHLDMKGGTLQLRPLLLIDRMRGKRIVITEPIIGARPREFGSTKEAIRLRSTGQYASGEALAFAGSVVISCQTAQGVLEFAVQRPDVKLVLHFLERLAKAG